LDDHLHRLSLRVSRLGKHYQRFLVTIDSNLADLVERLEQHQMLDDVELWDLTSTPGDQMRLMAEIGADLQQKLDFMATFYSLQFLHMNLLAIDRLELALSDGRGGSDAFREFLDAQAANYQRLNAVYIDGLLGLYVGDADSPEVCICVVGTRSDQDDVDAMVVHSGEIGVDVLNRAIGKVVAEFFRRAGRLHLYIAERMGISGYTHTVEDYRQVLAKDLTDFVMICEVLSAEPLVGSWNILSNFKRQVTDRFYGKQAGRGKHHIGFLRGLLGEMHSQLVQDVSRDRIDFKNDALRVGKGMVLAVRVVNDIHEARPVEALDRLLSSMPKFQTDLSALKRGFLYIETLRLLYHMLGVEEEDVEFDSESHLTLRAVADVMGLIEKGGVSAADHLVVRYFESVESVREVCRNLMAYLADHVRKASGYGSLTTRKSTSLKDRNVASELASSVQLFSGHIFFDDVMAALKEKDGRLAGRFVRDLVKLKGKKRTRVMESFLEFASSDPMTMLQLLLTIKDVQTDDGRELFDTMVKGFLARMAGTETILPGLLAVYNSKPALVNSFIEALPPKQRRQFEDQLDADLWDEEKRESLERFRKYVWLRTAGSEYYRRIFRRVIKRYPHFIRHLGDVSRLRRYASGFLAVPEHGFDSKQMSDALADNYDVAYLACAIDALNGVALEHYRSAFIEFADKYIANLYNFCKRTVARETRARVETGDLFALYASGGFARAQAFDDDYDLILIVNSDEPSVFSFFRKLSSMFHRELVRRGTLPQYRFSDHFGEYVTRFSQLKEWFASGKADAVDKTQILGARMLVGNSRFQRQMREELIEAHILNDYEAFVLEIVEEMEERHDSFARFGHEWINIKEGMGGLRDIEQTLLLLKAQRRVYQPVSSRLFQDLTTLDSWHREGLLALQEHHTFLRQVRDLYRLTVAAHDDMAKEELAPVAAIMGIAGEDGAGNVEMLVEMIYARMRRVALIVSAIATDVRGPVPPAS
jgi:hypothetical protein